MDAAQIWVKMVVNYFKEVLTTTEQREMDMLLKNAARRKHPLESCARNVWTTELKIVTQRSLLEIWVLRGMDL